MGLGFAGDPTFTDGSGHTPILIIENKLGQSVSVYYLFYIGLSGAEPTGLFSYGPTLLGPFERKEHRLGTIPFFRAYSPYTFAATLLTKFGGEVISQVRFEDVNVV